MHSACHEAPQIRELRLKNALNAYYVAPSAFGLRYPTNNQSKRTRASSSCKTTEVSPPPPLLSCLENASDKPMEDYGLELRKVFFPTPPSKNRAFNFAAATPFQRRRQRQAATEASATAAALQTLQRQEQRQRQQKELPATASSRGQAYSGFSLEVWKPPCHCTDYTVSPEAPATRKIAKVTSPHAVSATALASAVQPNPLERSSSESNNINNKKNTTKLAWRLRRCGASLSDGPIAIGGLSRISALLDQKKNPLDVLRHLGSATLNDAPLHTFLSNLELCLPSSLSSIGANDTNTKETPPTATAAVAMEQSRWYTFRDNDQRRRYSSRQRADAVTVHLGDVEARTFRVEVVPGATSPLQALVEAYHGYSWDGSKFFLLPLEDRPRVALDAVVSPHFVKDLALLLNDMGSATPSGEQTTSLSFGAESQTGLDIQGVPINFLRSAINSFETPDATGEDSNINNGQSYGQQVLASGAVGVGVLNNGPISEREVEGSAGNTEAAKSVVPCWKRFSTTAALYLTLGDAGCCDTAYFPYLAVKLCTWGEFVAQRQTRIEMMASCSAAAIQTLQAARYDKKAQPVPVAVMLPTSQKGFMRRPLSLTTQPFTDAEVFQLFYLQLVFRAYFDVRFPALGFRLPERAEWHLRSDFIAVRSSGNHGVAFEHPLHHNMWLRFPTHTRLLTLLCLKEAVVPLYATPVELQESAVLPLFGCGDALPCLGAVGHAVAQWAATVEVSSPASAMAALTALFEVMGPHYRSTRAELWNSSWNPCCTKSDRNTKAGKPALLFRCGVASIGAALDRSGGTLSRFFVSAQKRSVSVTVTDGSSILQRNGHSSAELSVTSNTVRRTDLPFVPCGGKDVNTMLPSAIGTPRHPALSGAVLDLNVSDPLMRGSATTDAFLSTTMMSPMVNQSYTNTFVKKFDVLQPGALQEPEDAGALDASKLLCTSLPITIPSSTRTAAAAGDAMGSFATRVNSIHSFTKNEREVRPEELESNPLLSLHQDVSPEAEVASHTSFAGTGAHREENLSVMTPLQSASLVGTASPFTKQESLVTRWRYYVESGNSAIFDGSTAGVKLFELLGRGGSGLVYRGTYGSRHLPVAVKVLIKPDGMSHENYVRESLTDVAFYVLANQLNDYGISYNGRAHDFIVSSVAPEGLLPADAAEARRNGDPATTKLCYLVTDLMDGTIGRFLDANDDDFDPMYDQLQNSPLQECELFQFLFNQLVFKTLFDWRVLDLMLNNQLRGDNIGYRYVSLPPEQAAQLRGNPEEAAALALTRQYYAGLLYAFQFSPDEEVKYLRFPAVQSTVFASNSNKNNSIRSNSSNDGGQGDGGRNVRECIKDDATPLRFICMIDLGQGTQPNVAELVRNEYIGETIVPSCVQDDGFGRFWPLDELYCRNVDVDGVLSRRVVEWGSNVRVKSQEDALNALRELFAQYYPTHGVETPTEEELRTYLCLSWTPGKVADLKAGCVYRLE